MKHLEQEVTDITLWLMMSKAACTAVMSIAFMRVLPAMSKMLRSSCRTHVMHQSGRLAKMTLTAHT
jgi:hypothetical protein